MEAENAYNAWPSLDFEERIAFLQREASRQDVVLPEDVARYVANEFRSDASALRAAIIGLIAFSSLNGTPVTLDYTKQVLAKFVDWQVRKNTVDPFQKIFAEQHEKHQATSQRKQLVKPDCSVIHSLTKTCEAQRITQARQKFEVNMREAEREQLARLDVYERALEIRIRKQRRG